MRTLLNQYSYLATSLFVLLAVARLLLRRGARLLGAIALALVALCFVVGQRMLRTAVSNARTVAELDRLLARGDPLIVEVYSNY